MRISSALQFMQTDMGHMHWRFTMTQYEIFLRARMARQTKKYQLGSMATHKKNESFVGYEKMTEQRGWIYAKQTISWLASMATRQNKFVAGFNDHTPSK